MKRVQQQQCTTSEGAIVKEEVCGWYDLPYEVVIDHIIGVDLKMYGKMLFLDKRLQRWLHELPRNSVLYANLFKYNFPSTFSLLHQLTYADELAELHHLVQNHLYRDLVENLLGYVAYHEPIPKYGTDLYPLTEGVHHMCMETIMDNMSGYTTFFESPQPGQVNRGPVGNEDDVSLVDQYYSKNDARKISRFFAVLRPFGYANGSFCINSQRTLRSFLIEILRISMTETRVYAECCARHDENHSYVPPLFLFLRKVSSLVYERRYAVERAARELDTSVDYSWSIEFALSFDLDRCLDSKDITTGDILALWEEYLLPYMPEGTLLSWPKYVAPGEDEGVDHQPFLGRNRNVDEEGFYYESINVLAFAQRLTSISMKSNMYRQKQTSMAYNHTFYIKNALSELKTALIIANRENSVILFDKNKYVASEEGRANGICFDNDYFNVTTHPFDRTLIDIGPLISLCKETFSYVEKSHIGSVSGNRDKINTYSIFQSFLYIALNKLDRF